MTKIVLAQNLADMDCRQIEFLQTENLGKMVGSALGSDAMRRRWPELGSVREAGDLARLALMSSADLAEACPPVSDELVLPGSDIGLAIRSSGTSGRRKVLYHSWGFTDQVERLGARGVRAALVDLPQRIGNCLLPAELNGAFLFAQGIGRFLPALTFPLGSALQLNEIAEVIAEHALDTLVAGPAFATDLMVKSPPERLCSLRYLLYIGAPMSLANAAAIAAIAPRLVIRSLAYSASETGPIGFQCPHLDAATHHLHEDAVVVEVVDGGTGERVADGQTGEIIVTPLTDSGMALFRYRIGDRGRIHDRRCGCGISGKQLVLLDRVDDSISVDTTTISGDLLVGRLSGLGLTDRNDCQLQVLWDASGYRVALLLSPRAPPGLAIQAVERTLRQDYHLNQILGSSRCRGFSLNYVHPTQFARAKSGKVPLLYQATSAGT